MLLLLSWRDVLGKYRPIFRPIPHGFVRLVGESQLPSEIFNRLDRILVFCSQSLLLIQLRRLSKIRPG